MSENSTACLVYEHSLGDSWSSVHASGICISAGWGEGLRLGLKINRWINNKQNPGHLSWTFLPLSLHFLHCRTGQQLSRRHLHFINNEKWPRDWCVWEGGKLCRSCSIHMVCTTDHDSFGVVGEGPGISASWVQRDDWIPVYLCEIAPPPYVVSPLTVSIFSQSFLELPTCSHCHSGPLQRPCIFHSLFRLGVEVSSSPRARARQLFFYPCKVCSDSTQRMLAS